MMSGDIFSLANPQAPNNKNILPHQDQLETNPNSRPNPNPSPSPNPTKKRRNLPGTPGRKDSFITHRAFCDALADESARFTNIGANSFNFRSQDFVNRNNNNNSNNNNSNNNNLMGGLGFANPNLAEGFRSPDFGPILGGDHHKPGLPLWLNHQANTHLNPNMDQSSNLFMAHDMIQMANSPNNIFGPPAQSMGTTTYSNLSLSPLQSNMKEEPLMGGKMVVDHSLVSSLYGSENNGPAPMSATALLQKAAQMGSTKSGPGFFGNTVGVMNSGSSPSSSSTFGGAPAGRSELHQVFGAVMDGFDGGAIGRTPGGQVSGRGMHRAAESGGLTRDFLGMGGGEGGEGGPFSPQELAKFASMSSAMGLGGGHFTGDH
ncbi:zinc finger protein [Striga asiatica]|uniref:Zinc finger protein n=1 Tax=Striga asiatica TaxID=4170 RepID=A0A5A7P7E8_STRAF|nr:zinc finger protein [Striga asiatica]